jgi:hypothetical protein
MWAAQALSLDPAAAQPQYGGSSKAAQYLKVGAAAVGGGALLAVTGGLAAPAIAAGLGAAVTLAHGEWLGWWQALALAAGGRRGSRNGVASLRCLRPFFQRRHCCPASLQVAPLPRQLLLALLAALPAPLLSRGCLVHGAPAWAAALLGSCTGT